MIIVVGRIGLGLGYGAQRGGKKNLSRIKTIHPNFNRGPIPWLLNFL